MNFLEKSSQKVCKKARQKHVNFLYRNMNTRHTTELEYRLDVREPIYDFLNNTHYIIQEKLPLITPIPIL